MNSQRLPLIGWREWVVLPEFGITCIKAKVDTGARSSSIHAVNIEQFDVDGITRVRFQIAPVQHDDQQLVQAEAKLLCQRTVTDSGGHQEQRPVVLTTVSLGDATWPIELTLTNRDVMGFRMLLGRQAIRDRFLVDSGHSFLQSGRGEVEEGEGAVDEAGFDVSSAEPGAGEAEAAEAAGEAREVEEVRVL